MKPGIYDLDINEYHASEGISRSGISLLKKTPRHYYNGYLNPNRPAKEPSKSLKVGDLVHSLLLEPEHFKDRYVISKPFDKRTKVGKEQYQAFIAENEGKIIVTEDNYLLASNICDALSADETVKLATKSGCIEKSIYWQDKDTGVLCKARPDIWFERVIWDLKTTTDADYYPFQKSTKKYNYYIQAAMCLDAAASTGLEYHSNFVFIAVETEWPYYVAIYPLDDKSIEQGRYEYKKQLEVFAECKAKNNWPSYGIRDMSLPGYAFY